MFGKKKKKCVDTLDGLIKGLNYALNAADQLSVEYYHSLMSRYFNIDTSDGTYHPKIVKIQIDDKTTLEVPIISLIEPKELSIDSGEIEFSVNGIDIVSACELDDFHHESDQAPRIEVDMQPSKEANNIKFKIKFTQTRTSEGFMRIVDSFNTNLSPIIHKTDTEKED